MSDDEVVGFRFHPTDVELVSYYLEKKMRGHPDDNIDEINILSYEPWELPALARMPDEEEWYFLWAPDYKYANSKRTNRLTTAGYWKVTGKERVIRDRGRRINRVIGKKRTLVFHEGRGPKAVATRWVMTEYRSTNPDRYQKEYVICRLKEKFNDKSDATSNEPSPASATNNGNHAAEETHALENFELSSEGQSLLFKGLGLQLQSDQQQEPMHSNGFHEEHNMSTVQLGTSDPDEDFVQSLLLDEDELPPQATVHRHRHGFNPPKSVIGVYPQSSSDSDNEILNVQTAESLIRRRIELQMASPKIHQRQGKSVQRTASEKQGMSVQRTASSSSDEGRGATVHAITDLTRKMNSTLKFEEEKKIRKNSSSPNASDGSKRKGCYFVSQEIQPSTLDPPFVYIGNVFISILLFIFFIWEMAHLH